MIYEEIAVPKVKKKRVRGLVSILLARSALTLTIAYFNIDLINQAPERYWWWALPHHYVTAAIGVLLLITALIIPKYAQLGIVVGVGAFLADTAIDILEFVTGRVPSPVMLVLSAFIAGVFFLWLRLYLKENKTDP